MINDIIIRNYLKVSDYIYASISDLKDFKKRKYTYFLSNSTTIVVGYIIKDNDNIIEYPVIGMSDVRKKLKLKKELLVYIYKKKIYKLIDEISGKYNIPYELSLLMVAISQ